MTKDDLKKMSQDVLIMPFSEELALALHDFCITQTKDMDYENMSALIMSFLTRTDDTGLYHKVSDYLSDKKIDLGFNLEVIIPVLIEYIILLSIEGEEDTETKAIYSLMLKNALLGVVKGNAKVANVEGLAKCFGIYNDFLNDEKSYEEGTSDELIAKILDNEEDTISFDEAGETELLKSLIFDAACYRYQKLKDDLESKGDTDVKKVFDIVDTLVSQAPWIYVEDSITSSLNSLFERLEIQDKEYSLREIVEELQSESDDETEYDETLLLLRLINGEHVGFGLMREDVKMTLKEFGIYLYYELLTEYFLDNKVQEEE